MAKSNHVKHQKSKPKTYNVESIAAVMDPDLPAKIIETKDINKPQGKKTVDVKTKSTALKNSLFHLRDIIIAFVTSIFFSGLLLFVMFRLLPQSSWVSLSAVPASYTVNNFSGGILSKVETLNIGYGKIENAGDIILSMDGQKYVLKPYELRIEFNMEKSKDEFDTPFVSNILFVPSAELYSIGYSDFEIFDSQIQIVKSPSFVSKNFRNRSDEKHQYAVKISSIHSSKLPISVFKKTEFLFSTGVDIYIKEKKVTPPFSKIMVEPKDASIELSEFYLTSNNFEVVKKEGGYTYLNGSIDSFTGQTDTAGTLRHTYLSNQNEYEISTLVTSGDFSNQQLSFDCELSENKQVLNVSGMVNSISVANSSLYFSFVEFIANNMGAVVSAVFTAFFITYIPLIFSKK